MKKNGSISQEEFDAQIEELSQRVLEESRCTEPRLCRLSKKTETRLTFIILSASSIFAVCLYFQLGHPSLNDYSSWSQPKDLTEDRIVRYLKESPEDLRALLAYARELKQQGRIEEAIDLMDNAFMAGKDKLEKDADFFLERASLLAFSTNTLHNLRAEEDFIHATEIDPQNALARFSAAQWFLRNNKFEMAALQLEKLL